MDQIDQRSVMLAAGVAVASYAAAYLWGSLTASQQDQPSAEK